MLFSSLSVFLSFILPHLFLLLGAFAEMDSLPTVKQAIRAKRNCPMSPYATFLSEDQQETLHELVTEARQQGADEHTVKLHIDKYISKILSPQKYSEFQNAYKQFEVERRRKRSTEEKKLPKKVYDLVDRYSGSAVPEYSNFYKDNIRRLRRL